MYIYLAKYEPAFTAGAGTVIIVSSPVDDRRFVQEYLDEYVRIGGNILTDLSKATTVMSGEVAFLNIQKRESIEEELANLTERIQEIHDMLNEEE